MSNSRDDVPRRIAVAVLVVALYGLSFVTNALPNVPGWKMHQNMLRMLASGYPFGLAHPLLWAGLACLLFGGSIRAASLLGWLAAALPFGAAIINDVAKSGRPEDELQMACLFWVGAGVVLGLSRFYIAGPPPPPGPRPVINEAIPEDDPLPDPNP